ncbi:unnamed protein product [Polarella glacialis]|uniref:PUB domain-containing protein n=1 Tax=Polarella glacialis TaxID=89957 RepID=A0A813GLS0_POLGL|nr:unnamed protein product [Polarella glacialis]CAE8639801.1 unnamed protein product [Polarella glacialis]
MDNDQKLCTLLDSLGEGTDVDFARELLEAHAWDLEAALDTVTGTNGGATTTAAARPILDDEGYRAPMATGYRDTLLGPDPGATPWDLAFGTATARRADPGIRPPQRLTDGDLEHAVMASYSEHEQRFDVEEQGALAQAIESSWAAHEAEEDRRLSSRLAKEVGEQRSLAEAMEASYREQAVGDTAFRDDLARALQMSAQGADKPSSSGRPAAGICARSSPPVTTRWTPPAVTKPGTFSIPAVPLPPAQRTLPGSSARGSTLQRAGLVALTPTTTSSKPSSSSSDRQAKPSISMDPRNPTRSATPTEPQLLGTQQLSHSSKPAAASSGGLQAPIASGAFQQSSRRNVSARMAPGQAAAECEAEEADRRRREAEEQERSTVRRKTAVQEVPATPASQSAPCCPAPATTSVSSSASRAEAIAAAGRRRRAAEQAAGRSSAEASPPSAVPIPPPLAPATDFSSPEALETSPSKKSFDDSMLAEDEPVSVATALMYLRKNSLEANPKGLWMCLRALKAYIGNLARNPQDAKFQRIRKDNSVFCDRISSLKGATGVLRSCGFLDEGDAWVMDQGYLKSKGPALFDALAKIEVLLDQVQVKSDACIS